MALTLFIQDAKRAEPTLAQGHPHTDHGRATVISAERIIPKQFHGHTRYKHRVTVASPPSTLHKELSWYSHSRDPLTYPGNTIRYSGTVWPLYPNANRHGFDYRTYLLRRGIGETLRVKPDTIRVIDHSSNRVGQIEKLRVRFQKKLFANLPPQNAAVLSALMSGNRDLVDEKIKENFRTTGTAHLLAISGLHLALVAGLLYWLLGWVLPYRRHRIPIVMVLTLALMLFSGAHPPVMRAGIMVLLVAGAFMSQRPFRVANILCAALSITLIIWPHHLFNPGLYLSYAAVIGIIVTMHYWQPQHWYSNLVAVSLGAWLWTMPIILFTFNSLQIMSPFCNLLVVPLFGIFLSCEIALVALALLSDFSWLWSLSATLCDTFLGLIELLSTLIPPPAIMPPPHAALVVAFLLGTLLFFHRRRHGLLLSLFSLLLYLPWGMGWMASDADELSFLNVGIGDSTLITVDKKAALIDCGGFKEASQNALLHRGFCEIEYLILTHSDSDHLRNANTLAKNFKIKNLVVPEQVVETHEMRTLQSAITNVIMLHENQQLQLGDYHLRALNPRRNNPTAVTNANENNHSLVMLIEKNAQPLALLGGDIETGTKRRLLNTYTDLLVDIPILKMPHHGRNALRDPFFMQTIRPRHAIANGFVDNRIERYALLFTESTIINTRLTGEQSYALEELTLPVDRRDRRDPLGSR